MDRKRTFDWDRMLAGNSALTRNQIRQLFVVQGRMAAKTQPQWMSLEWDCHRSAILACSVMLEQRDWQDLEKQPAQRSRMVVKIADLWFFYVEQFLADHKHEIKVAEEAMIGAFETLARDKAPVVHFDQTRYLLPELDVHAKIRLMMGLATSSRASIPLFAAFLADTKVSWAEMYKAFVGKSALDIFRREHGYMEGHYVKVWGDARSDQENLAALQASIDPDGQNYLDDLYRGLEALYPARNHQRTHLNNGVTS